MNTTSDPKVSYNLVQQLKIDKASEQTLPNIVNMINLDGVFLFLYVTHQ